MVWRSRNGGIAVLHLGQGRSDWLNWCKREKTLLLLDGMEPLQSSLDFERGKIKDPALAVLVTELAKENPGLCVITTREPVI